MATLFGGCLREASGKGRGGVRRLLRSQRPWTTLLAGRNDRGSIILEALEEHPGRLCLRVRSSPQPRRKWDELLDEIGQQEGIHAFRVRGWPDGLDVDYDPAKLSKDDVLAAASRAWLPAEGAAPRAAGVVSAWPSPRTSEFLVRGPRRLLYLVLGCGSLVMTFVGLVIPGIPTVPFLFASSYYLARSSRTLHRRLLESRLLGQILRDWETHHGLSRSSKLKLAGITLVILVVTVLLVPLSPVMILLVAVMVSLTLIGVFRIPAIERSPGLQLAIAR
jgi:uncharacterized membrane protein YbaN (DUF454 family)